MTKNQGTVFIGTLRSMLKQTATNYVATSQQKSAAVNCKILEWLT